jgi:hypothetical protein
MRYGLFAALVALSGAVLVAHPILAVAEPPEPIKEKIAALNKSYSELNNSYSEAEKYVGQMNEFLETVGKNPSGWVLRTGKEIEVPMTKELAALLLVNGNYGPPLPPILTPNQCTPGYGANAGGCICINRYANICYNQ